MTENAVDLVLEAGAYDPITLVQNAANLGDATKVKYSRVLADFQEWGGDLADPMSLTIFADTLSLSRKAHLKAAVRIWADRMVTMVKGSATPENLDAVQATILRFEALTEAIKVKQPKGQKTHTWLSKKEVKQLSNQVGNGIQGARDRAALGLLVAAGLRREEAVALTFDDIKLQPVGEKMRTVLHVEGKGAKGRTVPISDKLANDLNEWGNYVGHTGRVCRSLGRLQEPGDSLSAPALFKLVQKFGARIEKPQLAPHDLRRSYAQIGFQDGIPITQLSVLLGHSSVATTQRYLDLSVNKEVTVSDFIPW